MYPFLRCKERLTIQGYKHRSFSLELVDEMNVVDGKESGTGFVGHCMYSRPPEFVHLLLSRVHNGQTKLGHTVATQDLYSECCFAITKSRVGPLFPTLPERSPIKANRVCTNSCGRLYIPKWRRRWTISGDDLIEQDAHEVPHGIITKQVNESGILALSLCRQPLHSRT